MILYCNLVHFLARCRVHSAQVSGYEVHLESASVLPDDFQVEYARVPMNGSQGQAPKTYAPPSQAAQLSLSDSLLNLVHFLSPVLESIHHHSLAMILIWNQNQCR